MEEKKFYYIGFSIRHRKPFRGLSYGNWTWPMIKKVFLEDSYKKNKRLSSKHVFVFQRPTTWGGIQREYIFDNEPLYDTYLSVVKECFDENSMTKLSKLSSKEKSK